MKKLILSLMVCGGLVGCTPYTTEFRCPIGQGMSCRSMSQVHEAVSSGGLAGQAIQGEKTGTNPQLYFPPQSSQNPKYLIAPSVRSS